MAKTNYTEPVDFIPEDIRKKYGLGEYNTDETPAEKDEKRDLNNKIRDFVNDKK